ALRAGLTNAAGLTSYLHDAPALTDVVADRFFDVDVLAGLHGPDGGQGMPVVAGRDEDRVDGVIVDNAPQILQGGRPVALVLGYLTGKGLGAIAVRIADGDNLAAGKSAQRLCVLFAANAAAQDGDSNGLVGALAFFFVGDDRGRRCHSRRSGGQD